VATIALQRWNRAAILFDVFTRLTVATEKAPWISSCHHFKCVGVCLHSRWHWRSLGWWDWLTEERGGWSRLLARSSGHMLDTAYNVSDCDPATKYKVSQYDDTCIICPLMWPILTRYSCNSKLKKRVVCDPNLQCFRDCPHRVYSKTRSLLIKHTEFMRIFTGTHNRCCLADTGKDRARQLRWSTARRAPAYGWSGVLGSSFSCCAPVPTYMRNTTLPVRPRVWGRLQEIPHTVHTLYVMSWGPFWSLLRHQVAYGDGFYIPAV
jgi:hypothetical protein